MADDFVPKLRAERDGARLREMRLATKLDDCVEILERRSHQIERARELIAPYVELYGDDPYGRPLKRALAILSESASDAIKTQDSEGSA